MKTQTEIDEQIAKLKEIKPRLVPYTKFGDSNLALHAAVLDVLEKKMNSEAAQRKYGSEAFDGPDEDFNESVMFAALNASDWVYGRGSLHDEAPAEGWPLRELIADPYSGR